MSTSTPSTLLCPESHHTGAHSDAAEVGSLLKTKAVSSTPALRKIQSCSITTEDRLRYQLGLGCEEQHSSELGTESVVPTGLETYTGILWKKCFLSL